MSLLSGWGCSVLKSGEIMPGNVMKHLAVRGGFFLQKTLFYEFRDGLCNPWRPSLDAGVEHPPMKDAVEGVLRLRMPCQVIQNFWRRRWKWRIA